LADEREQDDLAMNRVRALWVETCAAVLTLVDRAEVGERWHDFSCLPGMTIGALCGHLIASGLFEVEDRLLESPAAPGEAGSSPSYSGPRVATAAIQPDERTLAPTNPHAAIPVDEEHAVHLAVRSAADDQARNGKIDLISRASVAFTAARVGVEQASTDLVVDCWGMPLQFDDFLRTRILELAVHADDLAYSIALESSGVPDAAIELACNLGISVAIQRNGPTAVLRALFRSDHHSRDALRPF
jgi:hypothetical protein